ncbi:MAG: hypothetical protein ACLUI3_12505 [Christensenellales bacterium]
MLAPEGYALNETTCSFTVDENGQVSGDTVLRDDFTRFMLKRSANITSRWRAWRSR